MIEIIDYSPYSIAVFGDTKIIKDKLKELGGRYNPNLTIRDVKQAGWIFKKNMRQQVQDIASGTPQPDIDDVVPKKDQIELFIKQIELLEKEVEKLKEENEKLKEENIFLKEENEAMEEMFNNM